MLTETVFGKQLVSEVEATAQRGGEALVQPVQTVNPNGTSSVVLVCEHATHEIPASFQNLGLSEETRLSHAAWDPGAMAVARGLSSMLDAALVASTVSRLVYDCNRPPSAADAMPARSEVIDIPGNVGLSLQERTARAQTFYEPFRGAVANRMNLTQSPVLVTIHSFTPVYHGQLRDVEIGVLHDADSRLADAMLQTTPSHAGYNVRRNLPYGPEHGVTHTLKEHALGAGHLNVMLEIRNDLIQTETEQSAMAGLIAGWLAQAFALTTEKGAVQCRD
ncbi:N-formylglutamate amidohydrolase [Actibacterium lipolyticum]|uniref:N-formylglutamate amidohydrolase n=1 Tax=Actibacterium lipolyticum TaxID=1524263 RepID=A0A238KM73_9RHOB|nr:N-formylglutamate amidohydrolase [Actibacterium lipolyticum]SMX43757.1 N-formylglutamate amidohydrolase [Actibacterium lipolyticum]